MYLGSDDIPPVSVTLDVTGHLRKRRGQWREEVDTEVFIGERRFETQSLTEQGNYLTGVSCDAEYVK